MYKDYYHLRDEPFNITPDPRFLFLTPQHTEALNHLLYGIRQLKGFICLTGEVGTGKTTLCRALLGQLDAQYRTALILNPMLTGTQLLRATVEEFGLNPRRTDRLGYMKLLNDFLLEVNQAGGDAVLIIDEAQDMSRQALELMRLLSNLETASQKLLQIVLVGQPELRQTLQRPDLRQLAQRITVRYHLQNMTAEETARYIRHRIGIAGGGEDSADVAFDRPEAPQPVRFEPDALEEIYQFSRGTPRLVNAIGDKALLAGYVHQTDTIDRELVALAASELKESA